MRKEVGKIIRADFERELLYLLPFFQAATSKVLPVGMRLYSWSSSNSKSVAFILLFLNPKYDAFTVDLAYSLSGEWVPGAGESGRPGGVFRNGHYGTRIGVLLQKSGFEQWWLEPSPMETSNLVSPPVKHSITRIPEAIKDAVEKIQSYAIPEFRRLAGLSGDVLVEK